MWALVAFPTHIEWRPWFKEHAALLETLSIICGPELTELTVAIAIRWGRQEDAGTGKMSYSPTSKIFPSLSVWPQCMHKGDLSATATK